MRSYLSSFYVSFSCFASHQCCMLFSSMIEHPAGIIAKQLRFNHRVLFKPQQKSAVKLMVVVIVLLLLCYGFYIRCTFTHILKTGSCNYEQYKITFLVLNSAVNPVAYAVYKKDIKKEIKRSICCIMVKN